MNLTRRNCLMLACGFAAAVSAGSALARGRIVKVSLWDAGPGAMTMLGHGEMRGMGMGAGKKMPMAQMGIRASSHTVRTGEITFQVTNTSRETAHEMIISPVKDTNSPLPYAKAGNRIDEVAAGHLGEVDELAPGKRGILKVSLKPGRYILYCNVPGHYALGMWTLLTVKA